MRFAIVAGGEGSRLRQEGVEVPKPLVRLGGETLVARLVRLFATAGATEIVLLARTEADDVVAEAQRAAAVHSLPLRTVRAVTPSSMHSLAAIAPHLEGAPFCLTTVDTVFPERAFLAYATALRTLLATGEADGLMGVTRLIDDEKPLYVEADADQRITAFLDAQPTPLVSAGVYGLAPRALDVLRRCMERGESRLRNFQRALLADGLRLRAHDLGPVVDVDHAADIPKAEAVAGD